MEMARLGASASPQILNVIAEAYYLSHSTSNPVKVARWRIETFGVPNPDR